MIIAFADLRAAIAELRRDDALVEPWHTWNEAIGQAIALVDYHAERAAAEVAGGRAELVRAGKHLGGDVPYGRQLGEDGATLLEHEAEAELVRVARELRAGGMSYAAIARELAARKMVARTGKPLAPTQIRRFCLAADARDQPAPAPATPGTTGATRSPAPASVDHAGPPRPTRQPAPGPVTSGTTITNPSAPPEPAPATRGTIVPATVRKSKRR